MFSKIVFEMVVLDKMTGKPKMPKSDINTLFLHNEISKDGVLWKPIVTVSTCSNRRECHGPLGMTLKRMICVTVGVAHHCSMALNTG